MRKHRYAPAEWHVISIAVIAATVILLALISPWEQDCTGIMVFPVLFSYVIFRCCKDWLYVAITVVLTTVNYITKQILERSEHIG